MHGWDNFFFAQVGAAAALTGLIFVGVSINLGKVIAMASLPNRALQALVILVAVLVASSLMLVPEQPLWLLGLEVLLVAILLEGIFIVLDIQMIRKTAKPYRRYIWVNIGFNQLPVLLYGLTGVLMLRNTGSGIYCIVPAIILSYIKAMTDAWVLLIEINR
jgi:modulator of FtsH protease